jgi:hypothetical protein
MSELHQLQHALRQLIARGEIEEAIRRLLEISAQHPYSHVRDIMSQKSAAFQKIKRDKIKGLLMFDQELKAYNEISDSLLDIINMLDKPARPVPESLSGPTSHIQNMQSVQGNDNTLISGVENSQITIHQYFGPQSAPPEPPANPENEEKT